MSLVKNIERCGLDDIAQGVEQQQLSDEELELLMQQDVPQEGNRLQSEYERYNRPDRLRIVNDAGQFYDVIVMGDSIGVQPVTFIPDYSQVVEYHNDFNTAKEMLDMVSPGWYVQTGITAANTLNVLKRSSYAGALTRLAGALLAFDLSADNVVPVDKYDPYQGLDDETLELLKEDPYLQELGDPIEYVPRNDWDEENDRRKTEEEVKEEEARKNQERLERKKILDKKQKEYEEEIGEPAMYNKEKDEFYPAKLDFQRDIDILDQYQQMGGKDNVLYVRDIAESNLYGIIINDDGTFGVQPLPTTIDYSKEPIKAKDQEEVKNILDNALGRGWKYWDTTELNKSKEEGTQPVTGTYLSGALLQIAAAYVAL